MPIPYTREAIYDIFSAHQQTNKETNMRQQREITGVMSHPSYDLYNGIQTIRVTTEPNGTVFINGVFGCSKNYPSYDAAIADIQHRHSFTFKAND